MKYKLLVVYADTRFEEIQFANLLNAVEVGTAMVMLNEHNIVYSYITLSKAFASGKQKMILGVCLSCAVYIQKL